MSDDDTRAGLLKPGTTIRYMREGRPIRLIQMVTRAGRPRCVQCGQRVPADTGGRHRRGGLTWFCTGTCALDFANWVAGEAWVQDEQMRGAA